MSRLLLSRAMAIGAQLYPERLTAGYLDPDSPASCPLGAAFLGSLHGPADVAKFLALLRNSSRESISEFIHHGLMKAFPVLGWSLRELPALRRTLGKHLPDGVRYKSGTRQLQHPPSLYCTITHLHDHLGWEKPRIVMALAQVGL